MRSFAAAASVAALLLCVGSARAEGWRWFREHVHPTHRCGGAREVAASYYDQGPRTFTGERFDPAAMRAATPAKDGWPMGARLRLRNPRNGRTVEVKINDRLPMGEAFRSGVRLDLTPAAHRALGLSATGWICASSAG